MFVSEFWAGVFVTLATEIITLFVWAGIRIKRSRGKHYGKF